VFEIYAYGNVDSLTGIFNAIAAIMGGADYFGLIRTIAVTGVLVAACAGLFTPGRFHGWAWFMGFMLLYYALFLPKVDVIIVDKLGSQPPVAVSNVPIGIAFFGHGTSKVGDVLTRLFETAFQVIPATDSQLPNELTYQKNGVLFGNRLIQASRTANIADPQLRTDLLAYVHNCTLYDLQDGTIDPAAFTRSADIWSLMGNPNPARFSTYGSPVQVNTCPAVYAYLAGRLPTEIARARAVLAFRMNPTLDTPAAQAAIDAQLEQAYQKTRIANAAQGAADLLRQNIMINVVQDTGALIGQKLDDPASVMIATARANATAATNASFLTMGRIAEQALPLVRNVIEAIIYAIFPFVFLLFMLAHGRGLGLAIRSFVLSMVWIQLWPPLYAVLNYVATLASARNLQAASRMDAGTNGLALDTAASIYQGAISDQAIAGYMVISIPIIATAIIKGGEVAFQAISATAPIQSATSAESNQTTKGNITQDAVSLDQQQLAPNRTSAHMTSSTDAHGTTIQGTGPEAGTFRYQATMSRLATTFTFSERQASTMAESAREAETLANTERDAMQRSQSAALTHALGIQESYDRSRQRSGASTTSDGGSTSTQLQTLNSIGKEVNKRLGLNEDSTVGRSIAASASAGAKIPFTSIGGQIETEGRKVNQERLQSAYDYARGAVQTAQLSESTALMKDFRSSDAYQWGKGSRTTGTSGFDSSTREATEHQTATETAHSRSRELARSAQLMREWSSGAHTDFTNYAARRLSERGLLREEDPIRLQRAVSEIAMAYAKGGDVDGRFVPGDSALPALTAPDAALGWTNRDLRSPADNTARSTVRRNADDNDKEIRERQTTARVSGATIPSDDVRASVISTGARATDDIQLRGGKLSEEQGALSERYNGVVQRGQISDQHGGNRAVLDAVGLQDDNRARLGISPPKANIPKWRISEEGVPTVDSNEPHHTTVQRPGPADAKTPSTTKRTGATDGW